MRISDQSTRTGSSANPRLAGALREEENGNEEELTTETQRLKADERLTSTSTDPPRAPTCLHSRAAATDAHKNVAIFVGSTRNRCSFIPSSCPKVLFPCAGRPHYLNGITRQLPPWAFAKVDSRRVSCRPMESV